ncbi:MAG TPA: type IX secretion system membrane protein PorP/SprF [Bacteroidales bacterium]|nr:type IX secretion system membrane protein PorP/SprF [Bacteroidales bacterium]
MRFFKFLLLTVLIGFISLKANAQQEPLYSQYIMNGFLINPSIAGRDGYTTVNLTVREQWVGLAGAPHTYAASFQTRILKNSYISKSTSVRKKMVRPTKGGNVGLGGYVFNDRNGIISRTGLLAAYAYHIQIGRTGTTPNYLSLGLAATFYQYALDLNGNLMLKDVDDEFLNNYDRVTYIPDFNFGATYTTENYYVGFSMTSLSRGSILFANKGDNNRSELGHYYLTGGLKIHFRGAPDWSLSPSAMIRSSDQLFKAAQMDLTGRVYWKEEYWAGLSYRTTGSIILMIGGKYDRFYFGYAADFTMNELHGKTLGSHELTMAVKFGESARRYRWINAY